jgi:hypothetical protein
VQVSARDGSLSPILDPVRGTGGLLGRASSGSSPVMPPSVNRSNAKHWEKSPSLTEYREFPGRDHWTCAAPGWEEVADYALTWALEHAASAERTTA